MTRLRRRARPSPTLLDRAPPPSRLSISPMSISFRHLSIPAAPMKRCHALVFVAAWCAASVGLMPAVHAHPSLIDPSLCGDAAHPTTRRHHGAPEHDGSVSFLMSWAAPDGGDAEQPDENQPKRRIPEVSSGCDGNRWDAVGCHGAPVRARSGSSSDGLSHFPSRRRVDG